MHFVQGVTRKNCYIYKRVRRREGSNTTIMIVLSGMNIMIKMTVCIDLIQNRIEYTDISFNHPH